MRKPSYILILLVTIIALVGIGRQILAQSETTDPPVLPCWDEPNCLCRGTPENPKVIGHVVAREGRPIFKCIEVFDCQKGESLSTRPEAVHYLRKIDLPPFSTLDDPCMVNCGLVWDVNWVGECIGPEEGHCSVLYFRWANTVGYAGTWRLLSEVMDEEGDRVYVALDITITKRYAPDVRLGLDLKYPLRED